MKTIKLFFTIFTICFVLLSAATTLKAQDKSITIDYNYFGVLGTLDNYSDHQVQDVSVRTGAGASLYFTKDLKIHSWAAWDYNGESLMEIMMFGATYTPTSKLNFSAGRIPTQTALKRPHPLTGNGHFEDWTLGQLPGLALGGSIGFKTSSFALGTGVYHRLQHAELHGRFEVQDNFFAVGYYNTNKKNWGYALDGRYDVLHFQAVVTDSLYGGLTSVNIPGPLELCAYGVGGWNRDNSRLKQEFGIVKSFEKSPIHGILGVGYEGVMKAVRGYVLIYF